MTVPSVVGLPEAEARAILEDAGFTVVARNADVFDPGDDGIVQRQSPAAESTAPRGSQVTILVGRFPGGGDTTAPDTTAP